MQLQPRLERPPIFIGGAAEAALARAVRHGDGWMPVGLSPAHLAPHVIALQALAAEAGRPPLEVVHMKTPSLADPPAALALAQAYAAVGVTHLVHTLGVTDAAAFAAMVDTLCEQVHASLCRGRPLP